MATRWWPKEVQLETSPQHGVVDLADTTLPGGAGIRHQDIDTAECQGGCRERSGDRNVIGHIAFERDSVYLVCDHLGGVQIKVEQGDFRTGGPKGARASLADFAGRSGDGDDMARQRLLGRAAKLRLFERPIFDVEHVGLAQRLIRPQQFRVGDHSDIVLV